MEFIHSAECDTMHNSALININMIDTAAKVGIPRYFFSSSVCVYRDMEPGEPALTETDAVPVHPDNEYGWEKLTVIDVSGKDIRIEYVEGPVGVHSRNFSKERIKSLGWEAKVTLKEGIAHTYRWIEEQVRASKVRV